MTINTGYEWREYYDYIDRNYVYYKNVCLDIKCDINEKLVYVNKG